MYKTMTVVFISLFLCACAGPTPSPTPAPTETQVPLPSPTKIPDPTSTPTLSASDIDLESVLIQPGDFPLGYAAGETGTEWENWVTSLGTKQQYQVIEDDNGQTTGVVQVFLYESPEQAEHAYTLAVKNKLANMTDGDPEILSRIGEQGAGEGFSVGTIATYDFVFLRCSTVAYTKMTADDFIEGNLDEEDLQDLREVALSYAEKLDVRLTEMSCP